MEIRDINNPIAEIYGDYSKRFGDLWSKQVDQIKTRFNGALEQVLIPGSDKVDIPTLIVQLNKIVEVLKYIKEDESLNYQFLSDITATDEVADEPTGFRFFVVYHLYSHATLSRLRVKVKVPEGTEVPTLTPLWKAANWAEREIWDMFGIRFTGHPDLRRILMDERWQGHPLRKDYSLRGYQLFPTPMEVRPELLQSDEEKKSEHFSVEHDPDDLWGDSRVIVNVGPTHPAMHGALRMVAKLNGETIENSYCEFGYTHRAKEKLGENRTYHQFIVYTDRLNYCSALINNVTYAMSVERLVGVQVPERTTWIRMICCELARVIDHLICVGINAVDLGAFSFFLYGFHQREEAYTLIEQLCGARLTTSYTRIGGLMHDAPEGWEKDVKNWVKKTRTVIDEMDKLLTQNKIWLQRTVGIGTFTKEQCMQYSYSGPSARAAGIDRDLRRDDPVMFYKDVQFEVPVAQNGDVYDRYLIRMEEIRQSLNIITQCCDKIKKGPIWSEDKRVRIPEKDLVHNTMEGLIHHFKFFMTGFDVPKGEAYTQFEGANGELAFYIVSKGGPSAHRMRIRGPSVYHFAGLTEMSNGQKLADMVASIGSINIIAGELDR